MAARRPLCLGNAATSIALAHAAAWKWADKPNQAATRAATDRLVRGGDSASGEHDGHAGIVCIIRTQLDALSFVWRWVRMK